MLCKILPYIYYTIAHRAGTFGAIFQYGLDHQVSEHSVVSAQMSVGSHVGVSLKLKLVWYTQVYYIAGLPKKPGILEKPVIWQFRL